MANTNTLTKKCFKCGIDKDRSCFYKHPMMGDGLLGKCKDCARADVIANRLAKADQYREYDKMRNALPERIERRRLFGKTEAGKISSNKSRLRWRALNKLKAEAIQKAGNALRDGKLDRKYYCESCGTSGRLHKHHDDYRKPLSVRWLCPKCHTAWHMANGEGKY